jgi:hypothetical protein
LTSSANALRRLLRWAKVSLNSADGDDWPVQQVVYLGKTGDSLQWFPYGYHANIPVGQLTIIGSLMGKAEMRVSFPGSPLERPQIASDENVVYHPPTGSKVHFRSNGDIEITADNGNQVHLLRDKIWVDTPFDLDADVGGKVTVDAVGNIEASAGGDVDVDAGGNVTVDSVGNTTITVGGDAVVDATGKIQVIPGTTLELGMANAVKKLVHEVFFDKYDAHDHDYDRALSGTVTGQTGACNASYHGVVDVDTTTKTRGDD